MALGANYISAQTFKSHTEIGDTDDDVEIDAVLSGVSRAIERFCGRQFNDAGSATARVYHTDHPCWAYVDDFSTVSGLVIKTDTGNDGSFATTISSSYYTLEPSNGVVDGQTGHPYYKINLHNGYTIPRNGRPGIQVTAQWGWASPPADVVQACLLQSTRIFRRKFSPEGLSIGTNEFVFRTPAKLDGDVEAMLMPYRRQVMVA